MLTKRQAMIPKLNYMIFERLKCVNHVIFFKKNVIHMVGTGVNLVILNEDTTFHY
jgi:hypothetical protein